MHRDCSARPAWGEWVGRDLVVAPHEVGLQRVFKRDLANTKKKQCTVVRKKNKTRTGARAPPLLRQLAEALHDRLAHEARGREPARLVRVHEEAQLAPHRLRGRRQRSGVARSQRVEEQVVATTARSRAPRARPHAL